MPISYKKCAVNDAFGGGIFICKRPVSPEGNGAYCTYHGGPLNGAKLELTWKHWFKVHVLEFPKRILWRLGNLKRSLSFKWYTRNLPKCSNKSCTEKALAGEYCVDHNPWDEF